MEDIEKEIKKQAEFATKLSYDDIPENVKTRARWVLLDSIGCILNGRKQQKNKTEDVDEKIISTTLFMVSTELYEGNRMAIGHPACHIIPLMLCESNRKMKYRTFLKTFIASYEIAARWGSAIRFSNAILGHGTVMTSGAVTAFCMGKNCSSEDLANVLLINGSLPEVSVWQSVWDGSALHDAYAGLSAVQAKKAFFLYEQGVRSSGKILYSVYQNVIGAKIVPEKLTTGLGKDYFLLSNYFKVHTGCRFVHQFADALAEEMSKGLDKTKVKSIDVFTYKKAAMLTAKHVPNALAGQFSIPVSLAVLIEKGALLPDTIADCAENEKVNELSERITLYEDDKYNELLPDIRAGRIEINLTDGSKIIRETSHACGDFDHPEPFTRDDLIRKFRNNSKNILNEKQMEDLIKKILDSDDNILLDEVLNTYDNL